MIGIEYNLLGSVSDVMRILFKKPSERDRLFGKGIIKPVYDNAREGLLSSTFIYHTKDRVTVVLEMLHAVRGSYIRFYGELSDINKTKGRLEKKLEIFLGKGEKVK